jgi:hypothetical protein
MQWVTFGEFPKQRRVENRLLSEKQAFSLQEQTGLHRFLSQTFPPIVHEAG